MCGMARNDSMHTYSICLLFSPVGAPNFTYCECYGLQVKSLLDELLEKLPEEFNITELQSKVEEKTPYVLVALQECERMNNLTSEIRRSLKELDLGLKVSFNEITVANK